jgi:hypothetical protein
MTASSQPLQLSLDARDHLARSSLPAAPTQRSPMLWLAVGMIVIAGAAATYLLNRREPSADTVTTDAAPAVPTERVEAQPAVEPTVQTPEPAPSAPTAEAVEEEPEEVEAPAPAPKPQAAAPRKTVAKKKVRVPPVTGPVLLVKPSRPAVTSDDDELKAAARAAARLAEQESGAPPAPPSPDGE